MPPKFMNKIVIFRSVCYIKIDKRQFCMKKDASHYSSKKSNNSTLPVNLSSLLHHEHQGGSTFSGNDEILNPTTIERETEFLTSGISFNFQGESLVTVTDGLTVATVTIIVTLGDKRSCTIRLLGQVATPFCLH